MTKTFVTLLAAAKTAKTAEEAYAVVNEACEKLQRNRNRVAFLSCMHGRADDAAHFSAKCTEWSKIYDQIVAIWAEFAKALTTEQVVAIIVAA